MAFNPRFAPLGFGPSLMGEIMHKKIVLEHDARLLGVELDPGEGQEELRERVEAVKAGDFRACSVSTWEPVREQRARVAEEAAKLAIATGAPPWEIRDAIEVVMQKVERASPDLRKRIDEAIGQASAACAEEIRQRQPVGVFSGSVPVSSVPAGTPIPSTAAPTYPVWSAEDLRAENRRIGEEIATSPPEWAYPLAWRHAVMAVVEAYNNTKTVVPVDTRYWEQTMTPSLRAYHQARLDGLLPEPAMMKAVQEGVAVPLDRSFVVAVYDGIDGIACQAYERGRPGPGGVR